MIISHYLGGGFSESNFITCMKQKIVQDYNRDSIQHLEKTIIWKTSLFYKSFLSLTKWNSVTTWFYLAVDLCSGFWGKNEGFFFLVFIFCFIWVQKANIVLKVIANYFCSCIWKTCWYWEYNIIKIHYEVIMTIKVICGKPVQE